MDISDFFHFKLYFSELFFSLFFSLHFFPSPHIKLQPTPPRQLQNCSAESLNHTNMAPGRMHITNSGSAVTCSALPTCPETPRINRDLMQSSIYFNFLIFQFYFLIFALFLTRGCVVDLCSHARGENTGSDHCCQGCSAHSLLGLLFFFSSAVTHIFSRRLCSPSCIWADSF